MYKKRFLDSSLCLYRLLYNFISRVQDLEERLWISKVPWSPVQRDLGSGGHSAWADVWVHMTSRSQLSHASWLLGALGEAPRALHASTGPGDGR